GRGLGSFLCEAIEREIEPARAGQLEIAQEGSAVRRIPPGMENAPNDRKPTGPGKSPGEKKFVDLSLRHRRDDEQQTPECPANETGHGAEKKPGDSAPREHDEGSNPPAMITR